MSAGREALDLWRRAIQTYNTAKTIKNDNDSLANRCYYAAFHALSAKFALEGKTFLTHGGVQTALHRDLVKTGLWPKEIGAGFSFLMKTRTKADYGGGLHVHEDEAIMALETAGKILLRVNEENPDFFVFPNGPSLL